MINILENISLFEGLDHAVLADISVMCSQYEFGDGDVLISETDKENRDLYILISGHVEILSINRSSACGEIVLSKQDKDIFGEVGWLTDQPRTATIRANGDVEAIKVDGKQLMAYMEENTNIGFIIARRIADLLGQRLKFTDDLLKQILWSGCI
ncbi:cyclic nucleotide-binding domain-containing protein [Pseudomonadota bacterium]